MRTQSAKARWQRRIAAAALALAPLGAAAETPRVAVEEGAGLEIVSPYARDACERNDVPDSPARAFRDAQGTVRLIATHWAARALTGPSLDQVKKSCDVIFRGGARDDPDLHDDHAWLFSPYTLDGVTVFSLLHNEFQGHKRPNLCASGGYLKCWRNSVTWAVSSDGGRSFTQPPAPAHVVAALPPPYVGDVGRPTGYFSPSNIIRRGRYWYAFLWAERFESQPRGACLMRTDNLADSRSWRAWDGVAFTVHLDGTAAESSSKICAPVAPKALIGAVRSLTIHLRTGRVVATLTATQPGDSKPVTGTFVTTSDDLLEWSPPRLLWASPLLSKYGCADEAAFYYPALLDPQSRSPNFEDAGERAYLYLTRLRIDDCKLGWNRDLVRLRVRLDGG